MIQSTRLLPGVVHELEFRGLDGEFRLMNADASETLLFIGPKGSDTHLAINNQMAGVWQEEEKLILPAHTNPQRLKVWFKLTDRQVEIWNDAAVFNFPRCDAQAASRIAVSRLSGVENPSRSLAFRVMTPEAMALEIGYHVLNRRLERIESGGAPPDPGPAIPTDHGDDGALQ